MHFFAVALVPDVADVEDAVSAAMAPFDENVHDDGHWDWWVLGGRWTGVWSEYDPAEDPANYETCFICHGTGIRSDALGLAHRRHNPGYTCNGCGQYGRPGRQLKHAADWVRCAEDVLPTIQASGQERIPHTVISPDGWLAKKNWTGEHFEDVTDFEEQYRALLAKYADHLAVVVDYHT